jgi:tRNA(Ile)-lysidine synthase
VLAALSGGADSTAMAAALAALRTAAGADPAAVSLDLHALHVNHGIRPPGACAADEGAVKALCEKLNIPLVVKAIPPGAVEAHARRCGTGIEGAARHFRYRLLREEARRLGADAILTAHTAADRLETILMAFLRGSGPAGLGALSGLTGPEKPGDIPLLRPLLCLSRDDVLEYLGERGLSYCTDETNGDERYFRNRLRLRLVPFLDQYFPGWREPVLRLGETQAMTAAFLAEEAKKLLPWTADSKDHYSLSEKTFFSRPEILREEALFQAVDALDGGEIGGEIIDEQGPVKKKNPRRSTLRSFVRGGSAASDIGQCRLEHKNGQVTVYNTGAPGKAGFSVLIKSPGIYKLEGLTITISDVRIEDTRIEDTPALYDSTEFFAGIPLALCSSGDGKILAEDRQGRAAVIRSGAVVWKRKAFSENGHEGFSIQLKGGSLYHGSRL